jgi:hypothetical protein
MSIRSDVGIAIKKKALNKLSQSSLVFLDTAEQINAKAGTLFIFHEYNHWDRTNGHIDSLYEDLEAQGVDNYKIVEVCPQYPGELNDSGSWDKNPWNLRREVTADLCYEY